MIGFRTSGRGARYNAGLATIDELMDEPPAEEMISPDLVLSSKRASASGSGH